MSDNDLERRSRLLSVKLSALVRSHVGVDTDLFTVEACALGTSLVADDAVWIYVDGDALRCLGPALAWSSKRTPVMSRHVHLVVENHSGVLARRAQQFQIPISIWQVNGTDLAPAVAEPHREVQSLSTDDQQFLEQIKNAGAEALVEHGVILGEARGLEICRVVYDDTTQQNRLEVGIGAHDREAFAMVHSDKPTEVAIASVLETVLAHRYVDAPFHPYNHLAAERFARWRAVNTPELIGFQSLAMVDPPVVRTNVKDAAPCVAYGVNARGDNSIAVFSHGIDLDVVPFAVDAAVKYHVDKVSLVGRPQDVTVSLRTMANLAIADVEFVPLG